MKTILALLSFLSARLKEPSTWAAFATALAGANIAVPPGLWAKITAIGIAVAVCLGVLLKETKPSSTQESK